MGSVSLKVVTLGDGTLTQITPLFQPHLQQLLDIPLWKAKTFLINLNSNGYPNPGTLKHLLHVSVANPSELQGSLALDAESLRVQIPCAPLPEELADQDVSEDSLSPLWKSALPQWLVVGSPVCPKTLNCWGFQAGEPGASLVAPALAVQGEL